MNLQLVSGYMPAAKKFHGQRVVSFRDIDLAHQRPEGTTGRNFWENRERFIEGEDYLKICAVEPRRNKTMDTSPKVNKDIILITESGYLLLAKSFHDALDWQVQRMLVKSYFQAKDHTKEKQLPPPGTTSKESQVTKSRNRKGCSVHHH